MRKTFTPAFVLLAFLLSSTIAYPQEDTPYRCFERASENLSAIKPGLPTSLEDYESVSEEYSNCGELGQIGLDHQNRFREEIADLSVRIYKAADDRDLSAEAIAKAKISIEICKGYLAWHEANNFRDIDVIHKLVNQIAGAYIYLGTSKGRGGSYIVSLLDFFSSLDVGDIKERDVNVWLEWIVNCPNSECAINWGPVGLDTIPLNSATLERGVSNCYTSRGNESLNSGSAMEPTCQRRFKTFYCNMSGQCIVDTEYMRLIGRFVSCGDNQ